MRVAICCIKKNKFAKVGEIAKVYETDVIDQANYGVPFYNPHAFIHLEIPKELEERPIKFNGKKVVLDIEEAKKEYYAIPWYKRVFAKKDF